MKNIHYIGIGFLVLVALSIGGMYNSFVSLSQKTESAWADVETQYQRRADLIPNLVETVKGAANFQQETLTAVVEARAKATAITIDPSKLDPKAIAAYQSAQGELSQALGRLLVVSENYPNLTTTENFRDLQAQLEGTENRVAVARRDLTQAVVAYNTAIKQVPGSLLASLFGFSEKGYFTAEEGAENAPDVSF
jgi:LemA protein